MEDDDDNVDVGSGVSSGAQFGTPENAVRAPKGGEWDGKQKVKESDEDSAWQHDADKDQQDRATDFDEEESTEEIGDESVESEQLETESQEEEEERVEEETEEPVISNRAQDRIRELAAEAKAAKEQSFMLQRQLTELAQVQREQLQLQQRVIQEEMAARQQHLLEAQRAKQLEEYRQLGFQDHDVGHQFGYEALSAVQRVEQAQRQFLDNFQKQQQAAQLEVQYKAYENTLRSEVDKALGPDVEPSVRDAIYESAYAIARVKNISNPAEAVKLVAPIGERIKKATKRPQPSDTAHKVIATSGRTTGKAPGQKTSGKMPKSKELKQFER